MTDLGPRRREPFHAEERALDELRVAARAAEEAERELTELEARYRLAPSAVALDRLALAASAALEKEMAFEALRARIAHGGASRLRSDRR